MPLALPILLFACAPTHPAPPAAPPRVDVRFRPGDPLPALGPDARIDRGLRAAAEELASEATTADARITPTAARVALARAGYPGDAWFLRAIGGAAPPDALIGAVPKGGPVDVGWAWRDLPDGARLWILGWAPRRVSMDPVPRDVPLDGGVALRVDGAAHPRFFLGRPDGGVDAISLTAGEARWVARFSEPGEYRLEVVDGDRVELLFSLFVEAAVPAPEPLPGPVVAETPAAAEAWLWGALDAARARAGLASLRPFPAFSAHARAHAECLVAAGILAHATPSCPGVPALAAQTHTPHARHYEDVAAGDTVAEAWERILASPAHLANVLCRTCTHASIGVVSEPPRLFAVWEMLEFPDGEPVPVRRERSAISGQQSAGKKAPQEGPG